jgi:Sigma-70 region 2
MWSSVMSDPLDELAADPDVISGGGEDFSAFVMSRWPGLVRLAFGLTGDRWAAEDIAQATLARAFVAWRRVRRADDPDAYHLDSEAGSTHQGETRQQRIEEFLEENDVPVLALREGSWLRVSGPRAVLDGASTGRLFRRGVPPASVPAGTDLSFLLTTTPRFDAGR